MTGDLPDQSHIRITHIAALWFKKDLSFLLNSYKGKKKQNWQKSELAGLTFKKLKIRIVLENCNRCIFTLYCSVHVYIILFLVVKLTSTVPVRNVPVRNGPISQYPERTAPVP